MRSPLLLACFAFVACGGRVGPEPSASGARERSAAVTTPEPPAAGLAKVSFAAYGGQGVMPTGARDGDYERVIVVLELRAPAPGLRNLAVAAIQLHDARSQVLAEMREIISVKRLPLDTKNEGWEAIGAQGTAFDGVVGPERVRLRVEAWLHDAPRELAARVRIELSGTAAGKSVRLEVVGAVEGVWPAG